MDSFAFPGPLFWSAVFGAYVAMEPVTYLTHRFVMHGPGMTWHRSHHRRSTDPQLERNDLYPVVFAVVTVALMLVGHAVPAAAVLVPIGVGVSAYGITYLLVHDGYIHGRLPRSTRHLPDPGAMAAGPVTGRPRLDRLAEAHALHHRFGGEPYGMLVPVIPAALRRRAAAATAAHEQPATHEPAGALEPTGAIGPTAAPEPTSSLAPRSRV